MDKSNYALFVFVSNNDRQSSACQSNMCFIRVGNGNTRFVNGQDWNQIKIIIIINYSLLTLIQFDVVSLNNIGSIHPFKKSSYMVHALRQSLHPHPHKWMSMVYWTTSKINPPTDFFHFIILRIFIDCSCLTMIYIDVQIII